jgi:hypothetical protein
MWIILFFEAIVLFVYGFDIQLPAFFSFVYSIGEFFVSRILKFVSNLMNGYFGFKYPAYLSLVLVNVIFILVYVIISSIIAKIVKNNNEKKMLRVIKEHYVPTDAEEKKYDYHNYLDKFPLKTCLSLIIPLFIFFLIIVTRFDYTVCEASSSKLNGFTNLYTSFVENFIRKIYYADPDAANNYLNLFYNVNKTGYIDKANELIGDFAWLEYIIIPVVVLVVCFLWVGIISLIGLIFKKPSAIRRAKKARNKLIRNRDKDEYKFRIQHGKEYSNKSEEFISMYEEEDKSSPIATIDNKDENKKESSPDEIAYYEALGEGVKDLGVGETATSTSKPIVEREVRYIADEDYDIVLEAEPVIEAVEDDGLDALISQNKEDELFYEKYVADDIALKQLDEYENNNNVVSYDDEVIVPYEVETPSQLINEVSTSSNEEVYVEDNEEVLPTSPLKKVTPVVTPILSRPKMDYINTKHDPDAAVNILLQNREKHIPALGNTVLGEEFVIRESFTDLGLEGGDLSSLVSTYKPVKPFDFVNKNHVEDAAINILLAGRTKHIPSKGNTVYGAREVNEVKEQEIINRVHDENAAINILLELSSYKEHYKEVSNVKEVVKVVYEKATLDENEKEELRRKAYEDFLNEFRRQNNYISLDPNKGMTKEKATQVYVKLIKQKRAKEKALLVYGKYKHRLEKQKAMNAYALCQHSLDKSLDDTSLNEVEKKDIPEKTQPTKKKSTNKVSMFKTPVLFEKKKVKKLLPPKKEYAFRKFRPVDVRTGKVESRIPSKKQQESLLEMDSKLKTASE